MTTKPKTGERRKVRQPLRLDRLPPAMLDRIRQARAAGQTWTEIERESAEWTEWAQVDSKVLVHFPQRRLPHSNLQRWYDLRVEQTQREQQAQVLALYAAAQQLVGREFADLATTVRNALGEAVLALSPADAGTPARIEALNKLANLLAAADRNEVARLRLEVTARRPLPPAPPSPAAQPSPTRKEVTDSYPTAAPTAAPTSLPPLQAEMGPVPSLPTFRGNKNNRAQIGS